MCKRFWLNKFLKMKNPAFKRDSFIIKRSILSFLLFGLQFGGVNLVDRLTVNLRIFI